MISLSCLRREKAPRGCHVIVLLIFHQPEFRPPNFKEISSLWMAKCPAIKRLKYMADGENSLGQCLPEHFPGGWVPGLPCSPLTLLASSTQQFYSNLVTVWANPEQATAMGSRDRRLLLDKEDGVVLKPPYSAWTHQWQRMWGHFVARKSTMRLGRGKGWISRVNFLSHWKKGNCSSWG